MRPLTEYRRSGFTLFKAIAVLLALAGQFTFYLSPANLWLGLLLTSLAVVLLLVGGRWRLPALWLPWTATRSWTFSPGLIVLSAVLSIMAAILAIVFYQTERVNYVPVVALNLFAGLFYVIAFVTEWPKRLAVRAWVTAHWREGLTVFAITALAGGLRFYQLGELPRIIDGDAGYIGSVALRLSEPGLATPYMWPAEFGGYYMQAIGLVIEIFGRTPLALRLLPALAGTLAVPSLYGLSRYLFGPRVALLAAVLLATSHSHIHFSRIISVAYIVGTCIAPLVLYLFISGLQKQHRVRLALGGLLLAVYLGVYFDGYILAGALYCYPLATYVFNRTVSQSFKRNLLVFWGAMLIGALPLIVHTSFYPGSFSLRFERDGALNSPWLSAEMAATGQSAVTILAGRIAHAFLALNADPATDFYGAQIPLLGVFSSTFFVLGLAYSLWKVRDIRFLLVNAYFWSMTVAIGLFSVPPSADSYRMLAAVPAALLLAALGMEQTVLRLLHHRPLPDYVRRGALALLLTAMGVYNISAYFQNFAGQCRFSADHQTRFSSHLGSYLGTVEREAPVVLLSTTWVRYGINYSMDFLSDNHPITNVDAPVHTASIQPRSIIVATPDRIEELRDWVGLHRPGSPLDSVYDCERLILLAYRTP
ncbi:MAG: glycosyltransferase family 39 protein [Anaerolineales bacterium]